MSFIAQQSYKIDLTPHGGYVVVYTSQHDNEARGIVFRTYNQGKVFDIPANINVSVQGVKANGGYFTHNCTYSGNLVTMPIDDDMTDVVGKAICVLKFTNASQQKLATAKFILNVDSDSSSEGIIIDTEAEEIFNQMLNEIRAQAASVSADIAELQSMVGSPLVASTASAMTNHNKIYVYTGSESGYTNGNWYYWNGSSWVSGGVYNSTAVNLDSIPTAGSTNAVQSGGVKSALDGIHAEIPVVDSTPIQGSSNAVSSGGVYTALHNTDTTLTQSGQPADGKAVGDEIDRLNSDLDILFDRPTHIFDGVLIGNIISTASIYSEKLTDLIQVTGGSKVTYHINSLIPSDANKISNIKLVVWRYDTNGDLITMNSYSETASPTLTPEVSYIQFGISASLSNAKGESITCDVDVFYTDEPQDIYLGDGVIVKENNVIGLPELVETVEGIDNRVDAIESKEIDYTESGNAKTGIWEHLTWSSINGFVAESDSVHNHAVMKLPGEVVGGQYYTLAWSKEVRARVYVYQFSNNTYSPSAQTTVTAENWLPYNSSTHEYVYNKRILLNENTKYIAVMVYLSNGADNWQDLILDNIYFQLGMDATGYVQSDILSASQISAVNLFDQLSEGNIVDGVPQPPAYYNKQGYLYGKCERVNEVLSSVAVYGDAFIFVTDQHWYLNAKQSPKLIRYIMRHCHVSRLISGGDTDNGGSAELCKLYRYAFGGNIHHVVGNHDLMTSQNKKSDGAILYYMMDAMNDNQIGNNYGHYYYVDCHQQKIRYIVLSAFRGGDDSGAAVYDYSAEQLQWFTVEALDVPDGYGVIIFTHFLMNASIPSVATSFANAIDTYAENGKIIAVIQGHTHYDGLFATATGIPVITITCDKNEPWISGGTDMEPWLTSDRETGTIYEQAFDVIGVDAVNGIVHAIRIGGLAMNNYAIPTSEDFASNGVAEERIVHCNPVSVSGSTVLTHTIDGTITWGTSNASVASVLNGTVTGVSSGHAFVYAANENGLYEIWSIVVS